MMVSPTQAVLTNDWPLLSRAANWQPELAFEDLSVEQLATIARAEGIDFATALLHDRTLKTSANGGFCRMIQDDHQIPPRYDVIGIIPGAFHGQHKHTGADGVRLAETLHGVADRIEVVPVKSFGLLDENASTILNWLEANRGRRIALASISKGGADVKRALASSRAERAFATVNAWISVSGIVQGTPLVGWLQARPLRSGAFSLLLRLQGHRAAAVGELRRGEDAPLARWPELPRHLCIVHVCAFPLKQHLRHHWAPRGYDRLLPLGPNDGGGILLGDLPRLPGIICPIWGADHYFQPSWDATPLLRAIACAALVSGDVLQASQSAR
jgi:hypothetical protein